jgi:FKBP-type peptidyl-prolyl cis-trans isomerase FkpA
MMNRIVMIITGLALFACATGTKKTDKGYRYEVIRAGEGDKVKPGQFLKLNLVLKDGNDSVWTDTRNQEIPLIISIQGPEPRPEEEGMGEIFRTLKRGDSVIFKMPSKHLYTVNWRQPMPATMDPESEFTFYLGVEDIIYEPQVRALERAQRAQQTERLMAEEVTQIDAYLAGAQIEAQKTKSGLRYVISKEGSGEIPAFGDEVMIHYAGYLMNGKMFDTSLASVAKANNYFLEGKSYDPITVTAGAGSVIPGWEEIILMMKKGTKLTVWIPSPLAYGTQGKSPLIQANAILKFDMELIEIKKKQNQ